MCCISLTQVKAGRAGAALPTRRGSPSNPGSAEHSTSPRAMQFAERFGTHSALCEAQDALRQPSQELDDWRTIAGGRHCGRCIPSRISGHDACQLPTHAGSGTFSPDTDQTQVSGSKLKFSVTSSSHLYACSVRCA